MSIRVQGAKEHNLQNIDVEFGDSLTVVTGVSGSGKSSLVFDTLYHEARRRLIDIFSTRAGRTRVAPAEVDSITGLGPAVAVGQNLLNRNPNSTLATASGLHPFLRLLYANFGERHCPGCGAGVQVLSEDEIIEALGTLAEQGPITLFAPVVRASKGSHQTLLRFLESQFGSDALWVDGKPGKPTGLDPGDPHDIDVELAHLRRKRSARTLRAHLQSCQALGAAGVSVRTERQEWTYSHSPVCVSCGTWIQKVEPIHLHTACPRCDGAGCDACHNTGLHPLAAAVRWNDLLLPDLLERSVDEVLALMREATLPSTGARLEEEITRRLIALHQVGLGYLTLQRPSPSLSRGESQRVRLAVILTSRLEDMIHVLDEPTIGQHPADMARLLACFRRLAGPVIYVEHDRIAVAEADKAIDLGPGAGTAGGRCVFQGAPADLWQSDSPSGRYFSSRERVHIPRARPAPEASLVLRGAKVHNLDHIDVSIPIQRMTVITGVSGSGKSTLVEEVLFPSLSQGEPVGCREIEGLGLKPILVDQTPIGRNPRSNPATYTKLSDVLRNLYAEETGLSPATFSFNRPEGACPTCKGMGAVEVQMRFLPSEWIRCADCDGGRFSESVRSLEMAFGSRKLSIADLYELSVAEAAHLLLRKDILHGRDHQAAKRILQALQDVGLGYLPLGQPCPSLSGGEAQRVKMAKHLGRGSLSERLLILDEPSTGLHPQDLTGLLSVLDRLVGAGGTIVIVEHNLDVIRAADWIIDLGPGAGPQGGRVLYAGPPQGLAECEGSHTAQALAEEDRIQPRSLPRAVGDRSVDAIAVRDARAHNLKGIDVDFPKGRFTVVTGVSGSGKSSLVQDVLEAEARRRYLETLSLYERQSVREGPEAPVASVSGLGVTLAITAQRREFDRRATVGAATEILHHLAALFASLGERACLDCGSNMERRNTWSCPNCGATDAIAKPRMFAPSHYAAACKGCNGVGSLQIPVPEKLIAHPEKPLCGGAMYSPGFFPQGYLCKPFNYGYSFVRALAERYAFDPEATPWEKMSTEAQKAFLFGDPEPLEVTHHNRNGRIAVRKEVFRGFYGWLGDWDLGGTYTQNQTCEHCQGARLRPQYLAVKLTDFNIHQLSEMPLSQLIDVLEGLSHRVPEDPPLSSLRMILARLRFLVQVGLGYLHLNRIVGTLSAGEAQRIRLARLLGSGLASLTVLLDEPSRGMHPSEVDALLKVLRELREEGNTVIAVEHDPLFLHKADHLLDLGPGPGKSGGEITAQGTPEAVSRSDTVTGRWLRGERKAVIGREPRAPSGWITIRGAREHNLRGEDIRIPTGVLTGVCGVSGSGKSTLLIDILGRALAPKKHTTSVAREPIDPGDHDAIEGAPSKTILLDQARRGVSSPLSFLGLKTPLLRRYAESEDAKALGLDLKTLSSGCSACNGRGLIHHDMGFLPIVRTPCETCRGTGHVPEAWDVSLHGVPLPELNALTIEEVTEHFHDDETIARKLQAAQRVGLGYLVLNQPGHALSGGEVQRLKIAKELTRKSTGNTLYILDEPTVGQHLEDVARLVDVLHSLVEAGGSVVVIEHHPHVLAACDWLIELGPGGGPEGGGVIGEGTPEILARGDTPSAKYLSPVVRLVS
jgi:excinuclease ABC subunit A